MTDTTELQDKISESGMKLVKIANKLGVSTVTLRKKMQNEVEFKASEITKLSAILHFTTDETMRIFFVE